MGSLGAWATRQRSRNDDTQPPPCRLPPVASSLGASTAPCSWLWLFGSSSCMRVVCSIGARNNAALLRHLAPSPPAPRCLQSSGGCTWLSRTTPSTCSCSILGSALGSPPLSGGRQRPPWRTSGWQREKVDSTPRTTRARKTRTRGGAKARAKKSAAAAGVPQWPEAMPGILNFLVPDTPCGSGAHIALLLFPHMVPMAEFPLAKCDALRRVVVGRLERIGLAHRGLPCYRWSSRRSRRPDRERRQAGAPRTAPRQQHDPASSLPWGLPQGGGGRRAARCGARRSVQGLRALRRGSLALSLRPKTRARRRRAMKMHAPSPTLNSRTSTTTARL